MIGHLLLDRLKVADVLDLRHVRVVVDPPCPVLTGDRVVVAEVGRGALGNKSS